MILNGEDILFFTIIGISVVASLTGLLQGDEIPACHHVLEKPLSPVFEFVVQCPEPPRKLVKSGKAVG